MKNLIRRAVFPVIGSEPLVGARMRRIANSRPLTVLNSHRVDDRHSSVYEAIRPAHFDTLVGWLKGHFDIVTFGKSRSISGTSRPLLVLSFDDGYRDFIDIVFPILSKHGISANQNVIPACVESGKPPMNVQLQDFIAQAPAKLLRETPLPGLPGGADADDRIRSGMIASASLKRLPILLQQKLFADIVPNFERCDSFSTTPVMDVHEIVEVAKYHEIGSHSFEHATMSAETCDYVARDAVRCRDWHLSVLGNEPEVYAFPNGSAGTGHAEIVRQAGYRDVLLVGENFSRPGNWLHKRFTMYGNTIHDDRWQENLYGWVRRNARGSLQ
jgi:peptidoglycan/xylan/chitin deacetylase (PgdA/CDA1 family)